MKTLEQQLTRYAAYHRDGRNIATHFIGIPLIVVAVAVLLSRPVLDIGGLRLSLAIVAAVAAGAYYLRLDTRFGAVMCTLLALSTWFGGWVAAQSTTWWLSVGVGSFVVGWAFQFVGHAWEGRKPAFVDDLMGLIVGPLFVVAEAAFMLGMRNELKGVVEAGLGAARHVPDSGQPARPGP